MIITIFSTVVNSIYSWATCINIRAILFVLVYLLFFCLIVVGLIRLIKFLGTANKEVKLTRMELGKLAEEVQLLRKELKDNKER